MDLQLMERFSLRGKIALVTGASRGLGRAIALGFAEAGADLIVVARNKQALAPVAAAVRQRGRRAWVWEFDLTKIEEIPEFFSTVRASAGKVDILANVAGTIFRQSSLDYPLDEWQRTLDLNLTAPFVLSQWFARQCIADGRPGKIINIASLTSERGRASIPAYAASKGGIKQLTMTLAVEWAQHKINVNAIGPGYIATELTRPLVEDPDFDRWVHQQTPLDRWGVPDDLVGAAVFLASPASDFITGQVIYVDGGWLAKM